MLCKLYKNEYLDKGDYVWDFDFQLLEGRTRAFCNGIAGVAALNHIRSALRRDTENLVWRIESARQ